MELAQLNDKQKIAFKEVLSLSIFSCQSGQVATLFSQFSEAIGDCKLVDSSDGYLLKWLAGKSFT